MAPRAAVKPSRIARETRTIGLMLGIYCRAHHRGDNRLCPACEQLYQYSMCRLDRCPFGSAKPSCAVCPIHCYKLDMRQQVKAVMKYAGPRMLLRHPLLALRHQFDQLLHRKPTPQESRKNGST